MMALEGWYEPRMVALLRRRQAAEEALRKSKDQALDLRDRLAPLREDVKRLEMQKSCLEKKITLMTTEREERTAHHKVGLVCTGMTIGCSKSQTDGMVCAGDCGKTTRHTERIKSGV